jgi:peroxiredoxin
MIMRRWTSILAACAAVISGGSSSEAASDAPQVGQPYPDFVLPNIEGGAPVSLSQFRGKKVLLIQFASW